MSPGDTNKALYNLFAPYLNTEPARLSHRENLTYLFVYLCRPFVVLPKTFGRGGKRTRTASLPCRIFNHPA